MVLPRSAGLFATRTPGGLEGAHLVGGRALAAGDDRAGVAHALALGRRLPGDEPGHRLLHVRLDERRGLLLGGAADLADHDDASVPGSSLKSRSTSMKPVPMIGSPPMPTQVDWPMPSWVSWYTAS